MIAVAIAFFFLGIAGVSLWGGAMMVALNPRDVVLSAKVGGVVGLLSFLVFFLVMVLGS